MPLRTATFLCIGSYRCQDYGNGVQNIGARLGDLECFAYLSERVSFQQCTHIGIREQVKITSLDGRARLQSRQPDDRAVAAVPEKRVCLPEGL